VPCTRPLRPPGDQAFRRRWQVRGLFYFVLAFLALALFSFPLRSSLLLHLALCFHRLAFRFFLLGPRLRSNLPSLYDPPPRRCSQVTPFISARSLVRLLRSHSPLLILPCRYISTVLSSLAFSSTSQLDFCVFLKLLDFPCVLRFVCSPSPHSRLSDTFIFSRYSSRRAWVFFPLGPPFFLAAPGPRFPYLRK